MFIFLSALFLVVVISFFFTPLRLFLQQPFKVLYYACIDLFDYFRYKKWLVYRTGAFTAFDSAEGVVFGSGKTLSVVYQTLHDYRKYNDKMVFDIHRKKWVKQQIKILSNLTFFGVPFEKLENLGQIIQLAEKSVAEDKVNDTLTCVLVVIDECQNQLHCRSFKDNLSPMMLKALTECRHFNMSIYYDCPRFKQVDALLRQCTAINVKNRKFWRFQCQTVYDASRVEDCDNIDQVRPLYKTGFFIVNKLFDSYDTKEIIETLSKAKDRNDFIPDTEILKLQMTDMKKQVIN